jgi:hypothetical protein
MVVRGELDGIFHLDVSFHSFTVFLGLKETFELKELSPPFAKEDVLSF